MFGIILTFISAISISVIAAGYSIIGLATLFAGATLPIIAMGSALEVGKLVAASWLYNNWRNKLLPRAIKAYLTMAVIVLIFITSMGIFGFLSKAHLDQVEPASNNALLITQYDKQIAFEEKTIARASDTLDQLDKALDKYIDMEYVTRGLKERAKQKEERDALNKVIEDANAKIIELNNKKYSIEVEQLKIEAEVGPIKYIAELIYGDEAKDYFDEAVRWVIIVLIFVFDPLAVLLLIAANISLRSRNIEKEQEKSKKEKDYQREATNAKARAKRVRDREKIYKDFFTKLGKRNLKNRDYEEFFRNMGSEELKKLGLDPDEIRIKLDQIMEWNDLDTSKNKRYLELDNTKK
tara:strand:- start:13 stop:1068 length:1056 start_codon:yes stop_codon:yes gene_type:complete